MTRKTSFYYSFLVLPEQKRLAITAVFDFCRAVDDGVDLETDRERAVAALDLWRAEWPRVPPCGQPGRAGPRSAAVIVPAACRARS